MSPLASTNTIAPRLLSIAIAAATMVACGKLAGTDDAPVADDKQNTTLPPDKPGTTVGGRTDENIEIKPAELDFGELPCGTESTARLLTIHNRGSKATTYKVVVPDGTGIRIAGAPAEGPLPAGDVVTLQVFGKPLVANTSGSDIIVTAGDALQQVKPKISGTGASLELSPGTVTFGEVRKQNGGANVDVILKNTGNRAITIPGFTAATEFGVTMDGAPVLLQPAGTTTLHVTMNAGQATTLITETLKPNVDGVAVCGALPSLTLTGARITSDVTVSSADWGTQRCRDNTGPRDVTITNYTQSPITYDATLPVGSKFRIVSLGSKAVAAAGSQGTNPKTEKIVVQPILPYDSNVGVFQDALAVVITGPPANAGGGLRPTPLKVDVRGAVITATPPTFSFSSDGTSADSKPVVLKNVGNENILLQWSIERVSGGDGYSGALPSSMIAGQTFNGTLSFKSQQAGTSVSKIRPEKHFSYVFNGPGPDLCNPVATLDLTGVRPP